MGNFCNKKLEKSEKNPKNKSETSPINPIPESHPQFPLEIPEDLHISSVRSPQISSLNWNSNLFNQKPINPKASRESIGLFADPNDVSRPQRKFNDKEFHKELYYAGKDNSKPEQKSKSKSGLKIISLLSENESISRYKNEKKKISSVFQAPKILDFSLESDDIKVCSLLAQRSNINHHSFPVWDSKIHENLIFYQQTSSFFDFSFDRTKTPNVENWLRIRDFEGRDLCKSGYFDFQFIRQGVFQTCSVIAALISIISANPRLLNEIIHPQIERKTIINKAGKYGVKLHFNGVERFVEIDDFLPFSEPGGFMGAFSSETRDFSCSIVEKAIVKFYGDCYSKIESNAAIETFHLIGWIPEIVYLVEVSNKTNLWTRLFRNYKEGNFLINFGTLDKISDETIEGFLEPNHTYSLLEMQEIPEADQKILKLRNPWGKPTKSQYASTNLTDIEKNTQVFYIDWFQILSYFSSIYLSWNPYIYPFRKVFHSKWLKGEKSHFFNEKYSVEFNPQFLLRIPAHVEDFEIRILLERHILETNSNKFHNTIGFLLFPYEGERTLYPKDPLKKSTYSSREIFSDVLIFEASENEDLFVLVVLKGNCEDPEFSHCEIETHFSIKFYSFLDIDIFEMPFRVIKDSKKLNFSHNVSQGGSLASPYFPENPQWDLIVSREIDVRIQAHGPNQIQMMLMLMTSMNKRDFREIDFQSVLLNLNSGFFSQGVSHLESHLKPGNYRLMLAIKEGLEENQEVLGDFKIVANELAEELSEFPQIDIKSGGLDSIQIKEVMLDKLIFQRKIQGEWDLNNSKGISRIQTDKYQVFMRNPGYILSFPSETTVACSLRSLDYEILYSKHIKENENSEEEFDFEPPSLSFCLFEIQKDLKFNPIIEDSLYFPTAWGTYFAPILLKPSEFGYLLVCLNYVKGYEGSYELIISSDNELQIKESKELLNLKGLVEIQGAWKKNNNGGCCSELLFYKNPQFEVFIDDDREKEIKVFIEIECKGEFPFGMYLMKCDGLRLEEDWKNVKEIESTSLFLKEVNLLILSIKTNVKYTLLVCTHKPGQIGDFRIKIHGNIDSNMIKIKEITEKKEFQEKKTFIGQWEKNKQSIGFIVKAKSELEMRVHLFNGENKKCGVFLYDGKEKMKLIAKEESHSLLSFGCFLNAILDNEKSYLIEMKNLEGKIIKSLNFYYEIEWNSTPEALEIEVL